MKRIILLVLLALGLSVVALQVTAQASSPSKDAPQSPSNDDFTVLLLG